MNMTSILQGAATLAAIALFPACFMSAGDLADDPSASALEQSNVAEQFSKALLTVSQLPLKCSIVWTAPMGNQIAVSTTYTFRTKHSETTGAPMEVYWFADHTIHHAEMPPFTPSIGAVISTTPGRNRSTLVTRQADGGPVYVYNEGPSSSHKLRISLSMNATNTRAIAIRYQGFAPGFSREITRVDCPLLP